MQPTSVPREAQEPQVDSCDSSMVKSHCFANRDALEAGRNATGRKSMFIMEM